jgi:hypothetical protein
MAKQIIRLIHDVGAVINNDEKLRGRLKVVFVPNYGVSVAEVIMPGADLSEQISTAGTEASGTGNMKLALNGALTIGTEDGANIEIRDHVGAESIFIFGHKAHEIAALNQGGYQPLRIYESNPKLAAVLDALCAGRYSARRARPLPRVVDALLWGGDHYKLLADYEAYVAAQARVDALYRDRARGRASAIANVAGMGPFSSDRTIRDYAAQIWHVEPLSLKAMLPARDIELSARAATATRSRCSARTRDADGGWAARCPARRGSASTSVEPRARGRSSCRHRRRLLRRPQRRATPTTGCACAWPTAALAARRPYRFGPCSARWTSGCSARARTCGPTRSWARRRARWTASTARPSRSGRRTRARQRRRRLQPLGRPPPPDAAAPRMRRLGDLPARRRAGARYKFELSPRAATAAAEGRPVRAPAELRRRRPASSRRCRRVAPSPSAQRANALDAPVSIYEVHLGSWRRKPEEATAASTGTSWRHAACLRARHGLHAPRAAAGERASVRRLLGLPAARPVRADGALRRRRRLRRFVDARTPPGSACCSTGCRRTSRRRARPGALRRHAPLRVRRSARGLPPDWNTLIYNFGRTEVRNFLVGNALYWLERYAVDGLRVDAVASMLYRDYSRRPASGCPTCTAGARTSRRSLPAAHATRSSARAPQAVTLAEESTSFPGVSRPTYAGGLGFHFKWNMGWMHDTLKYMARDPVHRAYHHGDMSFGLVYAFDENFVLPLSHDEVVHGKGSLLGKMPGDRWQRFANLRAYYGFMWGHPARNCCSWAASSPRNANGTMTAAWTGTCCSKTNTPACSA